MYCMLTVEHLLHQKCSSAKIPGPRQTNLLGKQVHTVLLPCPVLTIAQSCHPCKWLLIYCLLEWDLSRLAFGKTIISDASLSPACLLQFRHLILLFTANALGHPWKRKLFHQQELVNIKPLVLLFPFLLLHTASHVLQWNQLCPLFIESLSLGIHWKHFPAVR